MYILEINLLSIALFANISSHSEGCFFLFVDSFGVQKFLSLIRSHLSIFIFVTLGGGSKKSLCCVCQSVLPMFSSKSILIYILTFNQLCVCVCVWCYGVF